MTNIKAVYIPYMWHRGHQANGVISRLYEFFGNGSSYGNKYISYIEVSFDEIRRMYTVFLLLYGEDYIEKGLAVDFAQYEFIEKSIDDIISKIEDKIKAFDDYEYPKNNNYMRRRLKIN